LFCPDFLVAIVKAPSHNAGRCFLVFELVTGEYALQIEFQVLKWRTKKKSLTRLLQNFRMITSRAA
jgi:hypothetical protein